MISLTYTTSIMANTPHAHYRKTTILKPYQATYQVKWRKMKLGYSNHRLEKVSPEHYVFETNTNPILSFLPFSYFEKSEFMLKDDHIWPTIYTFENNEKGRKQAGRLIFNWNKQLLYNGMQDKVIDGISFATQDRLTHLLQLQIDLRNHNHQLTYPVAKPNKMTTYAFQIKETETITTKAGTFKTVKLESEKENRKTLLWLAKEHQFITVKLQQHKSGKLVTEATLDTLSFL